MFQEANQSYTFGIESYVMAEETGAQRVNTVALRSLWINHLLKEQAQFDKADARRRPLSLDLESRNFFGH